MILPRDANAETKAVTRTALLMPGTASKPTVALIIRLEGMFRKAILNNSRK